MAAPGRFCVDGWPGALAALKLAGRGVLIAAMTSGPGPVGIHRPPLVVGDGTDVVRIFTSAGLLLVGLLPHALPEPTAPFLPLAAWILSSRRGEWDDLLAATLVTVDIAVPVLILTALWEVYLAPHVLQGLIGY